MAQITNRGSFFRGVGAQARRPVDTGDADLGPASKPRGVVKEPVAIQRTVSPAVGPTRETQVGALPEELELLRIQVETERDQLHLAESRLEQAKRWESRAKEFAPYGDVTMEQFMVAQDGALMRQSDVVALQKAALRVAELRLLQAQRGISCERPLSFPSERRLADVERRLAAMEQTVRDLRQDAEHVRHDPTITINSDRRSERP